MEEVGCCWEGWGVVVWWLGGGGAIGGRCYCGSRGGSHVDCGRSRCG